MLRNCDIVMKGGITSGVVYPLAIVELANEFRFRSIGGTSAGAIAAAVTAAAEYRRVTQQSDEGFRRMEKLPDFLAGSTKGKKHLLHLFPPVKPMRGLFRFAMSFIGDRAAAAKLAIAAWQLLWVSPLVTLLCVLPAIAAIFLGGGVAVTVLLAILGYAALIVITLLRALLVTLPRHDFGFSTGHQPDARDLPGVSDWLHAEVQATAGRTASDPPLTFGDLRGAEIELKMITTALTHGRPYELPFTERRFAFRKSELRRYFPDAIADHLVAKGQPIDGDLHQLPAADDLPIVVAARMSLSFPVLFALVPLYRIDYAKEREEQEYERSWFIDGGLCSNFPLNMFDSLLPRWPTFGINLGSPHEAYPSSTSAWMVKDHRSGQENRWIRIGSTMSYVAALLDTIRNWRDNTQMSAVGFRDRVVHIVLDKNEGGLNLDMDAAKVRGLTARGRAAGALLRGRFGKDGPQHGPMNWNSHRWTRYKIAMAGLQEALRSLDAAYTTTDPDYPTYDTLVARTKDEEPKTGYWWKSRRADYATITEKFVAFAAYLRSAPDFEDEPPERKPRLRLTPEL
jgi:predicted acylesterase/phospholipase RssA